MVLEVRCDCCKRVFPVDECIEIKDYMLTSWFRCRACVVVFGEGARNDSYYIGLYEESILKGFCQFGRADFNTPRDVVFEDDGVAYVNSSGGGTCVGEDEDGDGEGVECCDDSDELVFCVLSICCFAFCHCNCFKYCFFYIGQMY